MVQRCSLQLQVTLFKGRKRPGQLLAVTSATGLQHSHLFHITDRSTGTRFLIDTGAEVSVVPPSRTKRKH